MRRLLFNLHLYAALIAGAFIIVLGVTGGILAFEPEIDHLLHWKLWHVEPRGSALSITEAGAAVLRAFPGDRVYGYFASTAPGLSYQVALERGLVFVNQYTGQVLGVQAGGMDFLGYVHQLHLRLLIRNEADTGKKIVTWAGVAMLFLLLSGAYLWWPYKRITIERRESSKRFWFDVHATVGILSFALLLLLTITGLAIGFEDATTPLLCKVTGSKPAPPPRAEIASPPGAQPITPDRAFAVARASLPGAAPFYINVPEAREPYFVRLRYPEDLTPGGRSHFAPYAMVDPYTGKAIWAQGSRTAPAGARMVIANRAIHTGDIFGIPSKAVASLASLMAVLQVMSGALMWWRGRQARARASQIISAQAYSDGIIKTGAPMPDCLNPVRQILAAARFAAERHAAQRRKGHTAEPYVNHLLEVAELLARTADDLDTNLIVAALLHDTIEDVGVTRQEIAERFGEDVASLVAEVTDDKSLPKETRKALQIENAPKKSPRAQALSAADKIANVRSIATSPPANWSFERRVEYVRWARQVVGRYSQLNGRLAAEFQQVSADLQEWEKSGGTNVFF